jgi:hypothetical protein
MQKDHERNGVEVSVIRLNWAFFAFLTGCSWAITERRVCRCFGSYKYFAVMTVKIEHKHVNLAGGVAQSI